MFADELPLVRLTAPNLTPGRVGAADADVDWVRSIRHGAGPDGKPLLFKPSCECFSLGDQDLGALIAYLRSLPIVSRDLPENSVGQLGRALFLGGRLSLVPGEMIDHHGSRPVAPLKDATVNYGQWSREDLFPNHAGGPSPRQNRAYARLHAPAEPRSIRGGGVEGLVEVSEDRGGQEVWRAVRDARVAGPKGVA